MTLCGLCHTGVAAAAPEVDPGVWRAARCKRPADRVALMPVPASPAAIVDDLPAIAQAAVRQPGATWGGLRGTRADQSGGADAPPWVPNAVLAGKGQRCDPGPRPGAPGSRGGSRTYGGVLGAARRRARRPEGRGARPARRATRARHGFKKIKIKKMPIWHCQIGALPPPRCAR